MQKGKPKDNPMENYGYYDGMIPKGCVTIIAGQGASGKSTLMCYLASTLERVAKILIVSNEEPAGIISSRLGAYSNVDIASFTQQPSNRKITKQELLAEVPNYDLIFVDSLITFNEGKDINKSGTAEEFLTPFISAVAATGRAIVFLHHTNKAGGDSLQNIVSGSERLVSGVRHCKIVINDQIHERRFLVVVKDNTNLKSANLEILSEELAFPDGGSMTVIKKLVPTTVDIERIIYENSKASKIKRWDKEILAERNNDIYVIKNPPVAIGRVIKATEGKSVTLQDIMTQMGRNEATYFSNAVNKSNGQWVKKIKDRREVSYEFTDLALEWLESQS